MTTMLLASGILCAPESEMKAQSNAPAGTPVTKSDTKMPNAAESNPNVTGYMQGFPPPPDKVISARDGSFFEFPALRYSVVHMRSFLPTVDVARENRVAVSDFEYELDPAIDEVRFTPTGGDSTITWAQSLPLNYTDGILIIHRGKIVYERYFGALTPDRVHAVMSVTKSFTGTLASMLAAEGVIDTARKVSYYVPELARSGFGDATVREVMDMTTAIKYSEDYSDPNAEIWAFSAAGNPMVDHPAGTPNGYYNYLPTIVQNGTHGEVFGYRTVNAEVLGWIISKATNKSVAELMQERIWSRMGMEQDGYYQVDGLGIPFAGGGFDAGLRDLGRFGEMMLRGGRWRGEQIIPEEAIQDIRHGGNREAFARSEYSKSLPGWSYRNMWWITNNPDGAYMARGVHGQAIYIDPAADMVIVRLASSYLSSNVEIDPLSLPAYQAVADYLKSKE